MQCCTNRFWHVESGKQFTRSTADVKWKTYTSILGFSVMGIWEPYADGKDVNAVDVAKRLSLVATGESVVVGIDRMTQARRRIDANICEESRC